MTWDDFLNTKVTDNIFQTETDILCPDCGRHLYLDESTLIGSVYPNKYKYWCTCGKVLHAPIKWTKKNKEANE